MNKVLVLGASGGMGYALVNELTSRGIETIAFSRTRQKLERLFEGNGLVTVYNGDVFQKSELIKAAEQVTIIYHAINIPYSEWEEKHPIIMGNIVDTAKRQNTKLAIVDNIYAYGRGNGETVKEEFPKRPHTKKGKIRLKLENMAKQSGVPVLFAHFPDFYGPNAENTQIHYMLQSVVKNKRSMFVGDQKIAREYIFTPDGAKALVELSLRDDAYNQNWNIPGFGVITGKDIVQIVKEITGYRKKVSTATKNMIRFMGLFDKGMREFVEMLYLNENPVVLNGGKYEKIIGPVPRTSYEEGLRQTLEFMNARHHP
ncbi:nucleoside-diphosphate-sugar epimerase [Oikeobacillus pervagus]|uniref:Nucleoside-diphosphate-sugar epimerase n=1 Tax=Oikeobacillus pervagus TaxID=1325931 RepID=A0AAJ1WK34_9BACI|nr:SDR family NAD(P)-dependent oxidoreductase [Oikeobacillus pervagus]MDQ0216093.1 nucleoside-diphosphate-sugar epimerase [Oikeobacillus pervagus]